MPGSDASIPLVTLGQELKNKARHHQNTKFDDSVAKAIKSGRAPTIREVKDSVKAMLRTLMTAISNMDDLPRRRFASFKVFYTDDTPADYEPPHFRAADEEKDRWHFMTHDLDEAPDRFSIGIVDTRHHAVNLKVTSIASYLPSSTGNDDSAFSGMASHPVARATLSPIQEAMVSKEQAEKQLEDAEKRNVVWSAEDRVDELTDADAEGDDDLDYVRLPDGSYEKVDAVAPVGIRDKDGNIGVLHTTEGLGEAHFGGIHEDVPTRLLEISAGHVGRDLDIEETQVLLTPKRHVAQLSTTSPSSYDQMVTSPMTTAPSTPTDNFDLDMLKNMRIHAPDFDDTEMLDLETQIAPSYLPTSDAMVPSGPGTATKHTKDGNQVIDVDAADQELDCDCGVSEEDAEMCFCEGGCGKWFHLWCMGYQSSRDSRIPPKFVCFDCRVRADTRWELIKLDLYPKMLSKFKELALFRRAIKIAETDQSFTLAEYSKSFAGDFSLARQLVGRLEEEGFVSEDFKALDKLNLADRGPVKGKGKGKGKPMTARRANLRKTRYVFNQEIKSRPQYLDYFRPNDQEVENRLLALSDMDSPNTSKAAIIPVHAHGETQTQEETQAVDTLFIDHRLKRAGLHDDADPSTRPQKKMKMSVAAGVDLAE
ncbi:hypothetical protein B0H34DRAFT_695693 [Crassisporium funariophilum]|nr:hypothetical protein B0H34DRAFT_695693 [Crassisporium funariophilum]